MVDKFPGVRVNLLCIKSVPQSTSLGLVSRIMTCDANIKTGLWGFPTRSKQIDLFNYRRSLGADQHVFFFFFCFFFFCFFFCSCCWCVCVCFLFISYVKIKYFFTQDLGQSQTEGFHA